MNKKINKDLTVNIIKRHVDVILAQNQANNEFIVWYDYKLEDNFTNGYYTFKLEDAIEEFKKRAYLTGSKI